MDEKSINWEASIKLNPGFTVDALKSWFIRYPESNRRIIAVCVDCDNERDVRFNSYRNLCKSCAMSITVKRRYGDPNERKRQSTRMKELLKNRILLKKWSDVQFKRWDDPKAREKQSMTTKNRFAKMDDPGLEICNHHVAYDFNNPETLTVQVTRRFHSQIHNPKGIPVTERGYSLID